MNAGTPLRGTVSAEGQVEWVLARVSEVWVFPTRKLVLADRLSFDGELRIAFTCDDPEELIDVDEIVSLTADVLSLLDPNTLLRSKIAIQTWYTTSDFRSFATFRERNN